MKEIAKAGIGAKARSRKEKQEKVQEVETKKLLLLLRAFKGLLASLLFFGLKKFI